MNLPAGDRRVNARGQESQAPRCRRSGDVYVAFSPRARVAALQPASVGCRHICGFAPLDENASISTAPPLIW